MSASVSGSVWECLCTCLCASACSYVSMCVPVGYMCQCICVYLCAHVCASVLGGVSTYVTGVFCGSVCPHVCSCMCTHTQAQPAAPSLGSEARKCIGLRDGSPSAARPVSMKARARVPTSRVGLSTHSQHPCLSCGREGRASCPCVQTPLS